ncbi:MAG: prolipoprotein diacylglyceryl transferase [Acidimicrobiia bacterium]|nr:prolipoprotein diacylglyceryl transferase [Acidimicrobiia bacterium]
MGSIPSPSSSQLELGPLSLTAYGLMIALGVLAAVWLARRRWADRGGDPDDIVTVALWAVPAGLVGARIYHVITDWPKYFPDRPLDAFAIWEGGLGIPGGIALGLVVGVIVARRLGMRLPVGLDVVAPCLPLAQAIGRWGNWFNQELFGRPTDLPWALQIDAINRPEGFREFATFHPTFLYESLWNLALVAVLLLVDRRRVLRPGNLFVLYIGGYFLGRLWVESLRIDTASLILGVRVNIWMSLVMLAVTATVLAVRGLQWRDGDSDEPYLPEDTTGSEDTEDPRASGSGTRDVRRGRGSLGGGAGNP